MNTKSNLSPELLEKANIELGEDESKRTQMLEQFRAWIKNHPHIKNCRQGLLIFLVEFFSIFLINGFLQTIFFYYDF